MYKEMQSTIDYYLSTGKTCIFLHCLTVFNILFYICKGLCVELNGMRS